MRTQQRGFAAVALALWFTALGCNSQAPPAATITPEQIVQAAGQPWDQETGLDSVGIEKSLAYWADSGVYKMVGFPPEVPAEFVGKTAIRQAFFSWLPLHARYQVKVQKSEGDRVTAIGSYWSDPTRGMGVAPLVGTQVDIVRGGKIISETWTLTEQSRQAFAAAMARAAALKPASSPRPKH